MNDIEAILKQKSLVVTNFIIMELETAFPKNIPMDAAADILLFSLSGLIPAEHKIIKPHLHINQLTMRYVRELIVKVKEYD